jgi:hypothetical protein
VVTNVPALSSSKSIESLAGAERRPDFEEAARALIAAKRSPETRRADAADLDRWLQFAAGHEISPSASTLPAATMFRDGELAIRQPASVHRTLAALSSLYAVLLRTRVAVGPVPPLAARVALREPQAAYAGRRRWCREETPRCLSPRP